MRAVVLALGANMGDTGMTLREAVKALNNLEGVEITAVSPLIRTTPVLMPDAQPQDDYSNAVVLGRTTLEPFALLAATQKIEADFGRTREVRWGPRTLDIDIIDVEGVQMDTETLTLPHPRAHQRTFVLYPWWRINPDAYLVGAGAVRDLLAAADDGGILEEDPLWGVEKGEKQ